MKLHFVRSIRGLQIFLAIPIMNTLAGFMISDRFFEGVHQFWASVLRGWAGGRMWVGGWGGRWQQLVKNCPEKLHSKEMDTGAVHGRS